MTKADLVKAVSEKAGLSSVAAEKAITAFISSVEEELKSGGSVTLVGFGTFKLSNRAARTGRNPKSGETISIPASKLPVFRAGKKLKDACN